MSKERIWEIDIKGAFPEVCRDAIIKRGYIDTGSWGYGKIIFQGTEAEYFEFYETYIPKDQAYMKVIGGRDYDIESYDRKGKVILNAPPEPFKRRCIDREDWRDRTHYFYNDGTTETVFNKK